MKNTKCQKIAIERTPRVFNQKLIVIPDFWLTVKTYVHVPMQSGIQIINLGKDVSAPQKGNIYFPKHLRAFL